MRYPRKLKKGIRTLRYGRPKTKWQRKGQVVAVKFWTGLGRMAASLAIISSLPHTPHNFKPGGFVNPEMENNPCLAKGELVMTHKSAEALMRHINENSDGAIKCKISGKSLKKTIEHIKIKGEFKAKEL